MTRPLSLAEMAQPVHRGTPSVYWLRSKLTSYREQVLAEVAKNIDAMNEQNQITQAILAALEYRGFYDAGKYLDGTIWERIKPHILAALKPTHL